MTIRHVGSAITTALLACAAAAVAPGDGRAQEANVLPDNRENITLVGCFQKEEAKNHERFVLVNPTIGPVASVPDGSCNATPGGAAPGMPNMDVVRLERVRSINKALLYPWNLGRVVEVTGDLRREPSKSNGTREIHVKSFAFVPVAPPRAAKVIVAPAPEPEPEYVPAPQVSAAPPAPQIAAVAPMEQPVGTTGIKHHHRLPKTASTLSLTGLLGLLSLAAGLSLRAFGRRTLAR